MSFLLHYIPWYGYGTSNTENAAGNIAKSKGENKTDDNNRNGNKTDDNNTNSNGTKVSNNNTVTEIEMTEPTTIKTDTTVSIIESKLGIEETKHYNGNIALYYSCDSFELLNDISETISNETDNSVNSISGMFKWAFGTDNHERNFQMCDEILTGLDRIMEIDTKVNIPDAGVRYARLIEYETSPDLNSNIIRRMKHNQGIKDIFRVLWTINWEFKLTLLPNWVSLLTVDLNDPDLITVTKNNQKLHLYSNYLSSYRNSIQKAIELLANHHTCLQQKNVINHIDKDFLLSMIELYKGVINTLKILIEFKKSLNWMEEKRFGEYYKNRINLKLRVNFKLAHKYVNNY